MKINFGGKERGFQWGIGCIERYCDLMDGDLETLTLLDSKGVSKLKASTNLLLAAMNNYSDINNEAIDYNYSLVQSWLDEAPQNTMDILMQDFLKSKFLGKAVQDYFNDSQDDTATGAVKKK